MGEPVRVSVAALDPMLEVGATAALRGSPDMEVVPRSEQARVTVIVVDGVDECVLDIVRHTRATASCPEVVLVATDLEPSAALQAIVAGARGVVRRREADPARLARTVLATADGDCILPLDILDQLPEGGAGPLPASSTDPRLSERERAVLRLVADGHETGEIAKQLCYSSRTVTSVVHDITRRFRLRNRAHAVAYTLRAGLL
ncbi:response regulator transcription factor [Salinispora arenicola]|uniref:Transcriptional regulator, LuxR family n=1 Tax=Salinispora arenicola (strain CNS-205) TaxID=391037 RepID=A8LZB4_SALAI|nr:response regulator transcription factor [Salinispora arenicola]MCN0178010.1 response regulator transcription factor [Salinispora arenicola]NIL41652.1 response regulator transcription factor [Salinispora arenicola]NIL56073.1 response regulator transcription factor [Salinispora arenicola]NIL60777.1 response regulator transcription factor [Salinispora arenicola]